MKIQNLTQATRILRSYATTNPKDIGKNFTLERVYPLMEAAGNPQDRLKVVHIAGTSGKTSTAYFMAELLRASGKKIGMTVSPHVDSITERIQVNGVPISEELFCRELGGFIDIIKRAGQQPTYFEMIYAFSVWVFDRLKVDYVVLETGLGGRYDATNITARADKVCIITDIGYDHTHVLGKTLAKIAYQKIGIVHQHNHVFMYEQGKQVMKTVRGWTAEQRAELHLVKLNSAVLETIPIYQQRNWSLAYSVYRYLKKRDGLKHLTRQVLEKTQHLQVPGRMDSRTIKGKTVVMDGAHNRQKMKVFINSFKQLYPDVKPAILLSLSSKKDHEDIAPLLALFASRIIVTSFDTSQDYRVHSIDPDTLADSIKSAGAQEVIVIPKQHEAFEALLESPAQVCVITGSFYLLGRIRNNEHLV